MGGLHAGRAQGCRSSQFPLGNMTNGLADKTWSAFLLGATEGFVFKAGKQTTGTRHNTHGPQTIRPFSHLKQGICKGERKMALLEFFDENQIRRTHSVVMRPRLPSVVVLSLTCWTQSLVGWPAWCWSFPRLGGVLPALSFPETPGR